MSNSNAKNELYFPLIIAITALVLSIISGVVNYRQNNLASLESSLRDTRDQLQLAKSDIANIKMTTVQKLVDAEIAFKNQERLEDEKNELRMDLSDAHERIAELETQIRRMDQALENKKRSATKLKNNPEKNKKASKAKAGKSKVVATASSNNKAANTSAKPESADLDIYIVSTTEGLQQQINDRLSKHGFAAKFPDKRESMNMANTTTVFYYHNSYKQVARQLVKDLNDITTNKVILRKGASPFSNNKIVAHVIEK
ncbi:hypothetical protein MMIC_P1161 [Mariprofundus micogutta]|uniref:Uncharacterized protein n=1 Tax=Mariprofundus micogutta TaxID=1921010 RepID=A0A1L8CMQ9_9PROT|nr:hypothetical protein [Mariprofundus micogutta]GAV20197.1 hypothetical protein MMIC_P1161 [Mariprofundus micogutta]